MDMPQITKGSVQERYTQTGKLSGYEVEIWHKARIDIKEAKKLLEEK